MIRAQNAPFPIATSHTHRPKISIHTSIDITSDRNLNANCVIKFWNQNTLRHVLAVHKKESTATDIEMVTRPPARSFISIENQDKLIEDQQNEIQALHEQIQQTKLQIKALRPKLLAKRQFSTELKAENMRSLITIRKKY